MFKMVKNIIRDFLQFNSALRNIESLKLKPMTVADAFCLAAVALEMGVDLQEAKDGTWRKRFTVVDE